MPPKKLDIEQKAEAPAKPTTIADMMVDLDGSAASIDALAFTLANLARAAAEELQKVAHSQSRIHHGDFDGQHGMLGAYSTVPDDPDLLPRIRAFAAASHEYAFAIGNMLRLGVHDKDKLEAIAAALAGKN